MRKFDSSIQADDLQQQGSTAPVQENLLGSAMSENALHEKHSDEKHVHGHILDEPQEPNYLKYLQSYKEGLCGALSFTSKDNKSYEGEVREIYENNLYRISAYVFSLNVIVLLLVSIFLDIYEQNYGVVLPLAMASLVSIFSFWWLRDKKRNPAVPIIMMGTALTILCIYLLIGHGAPDGSSMLWVAIFPSTMVLYMGLRYGAISFGVFYTALVLLLCTPLESYMTVQLAEALKIRLLIVCPGSFLFVWGLEFVRFKTNLALHQAAHRVEQSSLTDSLTGLGNRRDFDRSLDWIMGRATRTNTPYSLAVLDIDHFKRINDTYGHNVGDEVLKHIADEVSTKIRNADRLFRWGGEEFTIIMPATDMAKAVSGAERIRKHIEQTPYMLGSERVYITISLGIYSGAESKDHSYPLHIADQCLYRAKSTGRNKVVGGI